jgi:hypothetical protein
LGGGQLAHGININEYENRLQIENRKTLREGVGLLLAAIRDQNL